MRCWLKQTATHNAANSDDIAIKELRLEAVSQEPQFELSEILVGGLSIQIFPGILSATVGCLLPVAL
jgi:hypothetical protein